MGIRVALNHGLFAIIDKEDEARVSQHKWIAHRMGGQFYAQMTARPVPLHFRLLHRFIMKPPVGMVVDHISGETLDNRRTNLRVCTQAENSKNQHPGKFDGIAPWETDTQRAARDLPSAPVQETRAALRAAEQAKFEELLRSGVLYGRALDAATGAYYRRLATLRD